MEVNNKMYVEQLLKQIHELQLCSDFENKKFRSPSCVLYLKGKQLICTKCRYIKGYCSEQLPKKKLQSRCIVNKSRNLTKKVVFYYLHKVNTL